MAEKIKHGPLFDGPLDRSAHRLEEPFQFPAAVAKSADVADRTHRNFDEAVGVDERLGRLLRLDDAGEYLVRRRLARLAIGVIGVEAADPGETEIGEHALNIRPIAQGVAEA